MAFTPLLRADAPPSGLEVLQSTEDTLRISFGSVVPALATALRRAAMGDVPALAFVRVDVAVNESQENAQYIEERIRLLPIRPALAAELQPALTCSGCQSSCPKCTLVFRVDVTHPPDAPEPLRWVTGADVRPPPGVDPRAVALAPSALVTPLTPLLRGERFAAELVAQRGFGRDAAQFAVTTAVACAPRLSVVVDAARVQAELTAGQRRALAGLCPRGVFDPETVEPVRPDRCNACMECCPREGFGAAVDVEDGGVPFVRVQHAADPRAPDHRRPMLLTIETKGAATGREVLLAACASLRARVARMAAALESRAPQADPADMDADAPSSLELRAGAFALAGPGPWACL